MTDAKDTFYKIVADKKLVGSSKSSRGPDNVICFSEAPISKIAQLIASTNVDSLKYRPFGVMFEKMYLYEKGARPAIYQSNKEFDLLHPDHRFRHVKFEPEHDIDFTWEREWRLRSDELSLEPEHVTLIIPNREIEDELKLEHHGRVARASLITQFGPSMVGKFLWHFIVLEDLGVEIPRN